VNGRTLTVNGTHAFTNLTLSNGAVITHSPTSGTAAGKLDITVTGTIQIDSTSRIDVSAHGFLGGGRAGNPFGNNGMTLGLAQGSTGTSGGSYGGLGGGNGRNPVYGDFRDPNGQGSGGARVNDPAGNGGGLVRIVASALLLNGAIFANGGDGAFQAGGGSGGGIRIDVGTLSGTGTINANGGSQGTNAIGGGLGNGGAGGRVAVYYRNPTSFNPSNITAFSGPGNNSGAGTVYLQGSTRDAGELIVASSP
jgi:hypothetical protein